MREKSNEELMRELRDNALCAYNKARYLEALARVIDGLNDDHLDKVIREARALMEYAERIDSLASIIQNPETYSY